MALYAVISAGDDAALYQIRIGIRNTTAHIAGDERIVLAMDDQNGNLSASHSFLSSSLADIEAAENFSAEDNKRPDQFGRIAKFFAYRKDNILGRGVWAVCYDAFYIKRQGK